MLIEDYRQHIELLKTSILDKFPKLSKYIKFECFIVGCDTVIQFNINYNDILIYKFYFSENYGELFDNICDIKSNTLNKIIGKMLRQFKYYDIIKINCMLVKK